MEPMMVYAQTIKGPLGLNIAHEPRSISDILNAIVERRAVDPSSRSERVTKVNSHQGHILIVDDNRANSDLLARFLRSEGHTTITADDGVEALRQLQTQAIDLVLLDVMMPKMDGYQVLEAMRRDPALARIPVIMVTAVDEMDSVVKCIELGAEDYLFKPVKGALLKARVNASLEKKFAHDRQRTQTEELTHLNQLAKTLAATFNSRRILQTTLEYAVRGGQAQGGFIAQLSDDGLSEVLVIGGDGQLLGQGGKVALTAEETATARKLTAFQFVQRSRSTPAAEGDTALDADEWLIFPIRLDERTLGIIALQLHQGQSQESVKVDYLSRMSDHAAMALWNARLYQLAVAGTETQRTQIAAITRDLKLASAMVKQYISILAAENREINSGAKFTTLEAIRTKASQMFTLSHDLDEELHLKTVASVEGTPTTAAEGKDALASPDTSVQKVETPPDVDADD